jgi:hypothetical protein
MSHRLFAYTISLGFIYVLACSPPIHGQSPPISARCSSLLSLTSDDKAELIGKNFPKVIVDDVVFDGQTSLLKSIREQLVADLREHSAPSAGTDWLEEWSEGAMRDAWMNEGFFKMTSTAKAQIISSDATEQHVSVTVRVNEGIQYRLRDIRFAKKPVQVAAESIQPDSDETSDSVQPNSDEAEDNGQTTVLPSPPKLEFHEFDDTEHLDADLIFPPEELRKRFLLKDGDVLDASKIKQGLDALDHLYGSRGYIDFAAKPETITNDKSATISLILVLDEGKQFRVGKVEAYNLDPEREAKLKSQIQPGDIVNHDLFWEFFRENHTFISVLQQNEDNGTIDLQFGFPGCP